MKYSEHAVKRAIGAGSLFESWSEQLMYFNIRMSGMPTLQCPACTYAEYLTEALPEVSAAELELNPDAQNKLLAMLPPVFQCRNRHCRGRWCTCCWKEAHPPGAPCPLQLERIKKREDAEADLLHYIERRMDEARIRVCPHCKVPAIKEEGCNHITCRCGNHYCYLCLAKLNPIDPYSHFNRDHACPLHTNSVEDDQKLVREAAVKADAEWRAAHPNYKGAPTQLDKLIHQKLL